MGDREFRDFEKNLRRTPKKTAEDERRDHTDHKQQQVTSDPPTKMDDPFSHPVYNAISYINGQINRMDLFQVRGSLFLDYETPVGEGGLMCLRRITDYSKRPKTGRPVWQTGRKSVWISNIRLSDVRFASICPDFECPNERSKSGHLCPDFRHFKHKTGSKPV